MRTRTTTAALIAAGLLALTGCSSSEPAPAPTVSAAPTLSAEQVAAQCTDALAEAIYNRPDDFDPDTDTDPQPAECDALPEDQYLDTYMDALRQSNERGRQDLQDQIDEAAEQDQ